MAFKQKCIGCGSVKETNGTLHLLKFPITRKIKLCWECSLEVEKFIKEKKKRNVRGMASELAEEIKEGKETKTKLEKEGDKVVSEKA